MSLKTVLEHFINFRHEVVVRRTEFELKEAEKRAHILEGLKVAQENIDEVIKLIKASQNPEQAKKELSIFKDSKYKDLLVDMLEFNLSRQF